VPTFATISIAMISRSTELAIPIPVVYCRIYTFLGRHYNCVSLAPNGSWPHYGTDDYSYCQRKVDVKVDVLSFIAFQTAVVDNLVRWGCLVC